MSATSTNPDIAIVPVGPGDAAALAAVHAASFDEAWNDAALTRLLKAAAARSFGAFEGYHRAPVGFVIAFVAADEAEILTVAVAPDRRRAGLGARLVRALAEQLAQEGVSRLFLEVAADNDAARALYRRLGFVETGRRKGYYVRPSGPPVDALTLALSITAPTEAEPRTVPLLR